MKVKKVHIFGGGTVAHIANHFAVTVPAYGSTAKKLAELVRNRFKNTVDVQLELTRMAGGQLETNEDVANRIKELKADASTKIIFLNCALVDWKPSYVVAADPKAEHIGHVWVTEFSKNQMRLESSFEDVKVEFKSADKIAPSIRDGRKDIFLVAFKTTCGATKQEMYEKGLKLCKRGSCNLVLVNDTKTRWNMIVTPEEAAYSETEDREKVLTELVDMTYYRSQLSFTRSTVVNGTPVPWSDERVPEPLRRAVNHCIQADAYKPFEGSTVGHFAVKLSDSEFLTSIRKSDFNNLDKHGLVYVKTDGPDTVLAYGTKPSVGGQSQRIIFRDHIGYDCVLHFHSPLRENHPDDIPIKSQREVECGSHQCGKNTSNGLKSFGRLKAVMLDNHGPNIIFPKDIDPQEVIDFIEENFDLSKKTGGYNLTARRKAQSPFYL